MTKSTALLPSMPNSIATETIAQERAPFVAYAEATASIAILGSSADIWQRITRVEAWPSWNKLVDWVKIEGPLRPGNTFVWKSKGMVVSSTVCELVPLEYIAWEGNAFGTKALHSWRIETTDQGVVLHTSESFGGWIPWLFPKAMQRALDQTLHAWLRLIKEDVEKHIEMASETSALALREKKESK